MQFKNLCVKEENVNIDELLKVAIIYRLSLSQNEEELDGEIQFVSRLVKEAFNDEIFKKYCDFIESESNKIRNGFINKE